MNSGKQSQKQTMRYTLTLVFLIASILPILLFILVLEKHALLSEGNVAMILGFSFIVAGLGFLYSLRIVKQVNALAQDFITVERGEMEELGERNTTSEFSEMARIANTFNKTLTDLKAHTEELRSLIEKITTLSELTNLVSRIPDIKEILKIVLQRTMATVNARIGSIMLLDDKSQTLRITAAEGLDDSIVGETISRLGEGIAGKVAESGEAILVEDVEHDSRFQKSNDPKYGNSSFISMPLRAQWRVMGVLNLSKRGDGKVFDESDLKFLTTLLGHIGFALENARLLKEAKEASGKLQRAQKMEAIGTLAGGVAHDLNNILGGLVSYPELLLLQIPEDSPLRESILTIQKSGEKAATVVQDLLTLARRGVVFTEVVNPNDVISDYLKSPEHEKLLSYHPGVHIETHFEKDVLNILGSSTHLSKTMMNLVSNAAEAMPEGGKLTLSTENRHLDRPIRGYDDVKEGDYAVFTVSDTGAGISLDDMGKIFEPFYTKKKMGRSGTGLGMAVVWGTVKDHNGYIDVQSTEGKGTTFTLYFPVTREKLSEEESSLSIESYSGHGESILIVDDVEEQRKIASGMLKKLGYSVVSVSSGEEAVEYLTTNKVDLLLLDMIMDPGMDGLETYKKIIELHPRQKAIIASGFSETDRVKRVQSLGAGAYIKKPLLLEKMGLAVKQELEK